MTEGRVVEWHKQDGEVVEQGEPVVTVETEKVASDIAAEDHGKLQIWAQVGEIKQIGEVIGQIFAMGEAIGEFGRNKVSGVGLSTENVAPTLNALHATPVSPSKPESQFLASPLARRVAKERGVDIRQIVGTGINGQVTEKDVNDYSERKNSIQKVNESPATPGYKAVHLTPKRAEIAQRMINSLNSMAQFTLSNRAIATKLVEFHDLLSEEWQTKISFTDLFIKLTARALQKHQLLNSKLIGDELRTYDDINIGVAIATMDALIVPVIRNADQMSILEIHRCMEDLVNRSRANQITVDDVSQGTFTISNLGMFGVDIFTPIINPPEVAILGVGQIRKKNNRLLDEGKENYEVTLSLTVDHRVIDGISGAKFLQSLVELIEKPVLLFVDEKSR